MNSQTLNSHREDLKEYGWTLIKGIFSEEEVLNLRKYSLEHSQNGGRNNGDLLSHKKLQNVICDDRINNIAKVLLSDNPVYFGDSSVAVHSVDKRISHGLHKDSPDRDDINSPSFQGEYSVIRFGIYLQDHVSHSQGLIVRSKSHNYADTTSGKKVIVPSEPGDIIVWYLTTTHSGNAKRIIGLKNLVIADDGVSKLQHFLYYRIPSFLVKEDSKDRISLFFTLGKKGQHLNRYIQYLKGRDYAINTSGNSNWSEETKDLCKEKNIHLLYIPNEIKNSSNSFTSQTDNYKLDY